MHITASSIQLSSAHAAATQVSTTEKLHAWQRDSRGVVVDLSAEARSLASSAAAGAAAVTSRTEERVLPAEGAPAAVTPPEGAHVSTGTRVEARVDARRMLVERLFHWKRSQGVQVQDPAEAERAGREMGRQAAAEAAGSRQPARQEEGWGLTYDREVQSVTTESVAFAAAGVVQTSDGRSVAVAVAETMQSTQTSSESTHLRAGDALKDPLVLNTGGGTATAGGGTVAFDLDADGEKERVATLGGNSELLAMDRNGNGVIDDGTELFGATTGDGFRELAALDTDGNGWVDEGDAAWSRLRLFRPSEDGAAAPVSVAERDVGAILVASAETPFTLRDGNATAGQVRATSVYLSESGGAGTVQHVDLAVSTRA